MSRAAKETLVKKQSIVYSDFMGNLERHPNSGDLARVTNAESIKQSLKNLIRMNYGDKLFNPYIGSQVNAMLFDPFDNFTLNDIKQHIWDTVTMFEKRVTLMDVTVTVNANDENQAAATIKFYIINTNEQESLNLILKRVR